MSKLKTVKFKLPNHPFFSRRPKSVAMVGLGPSANNYWLELAGWDQEKPPWQEVWVVNRASEAFVHDVAFNMHDLRDLAKKFPNEGKRLLRVKTPLITTTAYKEYPTSVAYPLMPVLDFLKTDLVNSTPAWMVAYAMLIGVKEIYLYGMDFHYTNMERTNLQRVLQDLLDAIRVHVDFGSLWVRQTDPRTCRRVTSLDLHRGLRDERAPGREALVREHGKPLLRSHGD
jgi:hypothetical protein